jgi:hypothetical protein
MTHDTPEHMFPSTTSYVKFVKIGRPAGGQWAGGSAPPGAPSSFWFGLTPWPIRRRPLHLTIKYRGGAAAWVEIHARGRMGRYSGERAIIEILSDIAGGKF